jgi:D-3-phosphoglycerate dehydrogenase
MSETHSIVATGPLPDWVAEQFSPHPLVFCEAFTHAAVSSKVGPGVVGLVARGPVVIDAEMISAAADLRVIGRSGVGYDTVDIAAATQRGIPVVYTPGAMSRVVAEHTLALILGAAKNLMGWHRVVLEGEWEERYQSPNLDLEGSVVGIVGFERIGREVWHLLKPFGMQALVHDPYVVAADYSEKGVRFVSLEELLNGADLVTLHAPASDETQNLIHRGNIDQFKQGAILVNAARGALIESHDLLYQALESGRLRCVALDVFASEPPDRSHPLFGHPGTVLTAHVGSATPGAQDRIVETVVADMTAVLAVRRPRAENLVNPEVYC